MNILRALCLMLTLAAPAFAAGNDMKPASLHTIITAHQGWLNTSRPLSPEDLAGRVILLDFWTFCCINCIHVMPDLKYLEEKFGDKLTVIGVHSAKFKNEQDSENIRQAILRYGIVHPVVNDFDFSTWRQFGIRAWPSFVLINPQGRVESTYSGEGNRAAIERDVAALIAKNEGALVTAALPLALEKDKAPPSVLSFPGKIEAAEDSFFFVSDSGHHQIAQVSKDGAIVLRIGSGGEGFKDGGFDGAQLRSPQGLLYDREKRLLYIADTGNHALRVADFNTRQVMTLAGTGAQGYDRKVMNAPALEAKLASPWDLAFYPGRGHIAVAMAGLHQLWSYDIERKTISVMAGNGRESIDDGPLPNNSLSQPSGLSALGDKLYFVDAETSSLRVLEDGSIKTLIGTGLFDFGYKEGKQGEARMQHPLGLLADKSGIYIADSYNHSLRRYDPKTGLLSDFAGHGARGGKDGAFASAAFNEPNDILKIEERLYIADTNNNAIRVLDMASGKVSTLALREESASETTSFSDSLPNLELTQPVQVAAGAPLTVTIALKEGWKINADAPSSLALFNAKRMPVASFGLEALKTKSVTLPALPAGEYRLQGTLYYCEDKAGSQCLLKSADMTVTSAPGGSGELLLPL